MRIVKIKYLEISTQISAVSSYRLDNFTDGSRDASENVLTNELDIISLLGGSNPGDKYWQVGTIIPFPGVQTKCLKPKIT